jgi:hypothetical protein
MSYISRINAYWNWMKVNDLTSNAGHLYLAILDCANTTGWKPEFNAPNSTLMAMAKLDRNTLNKSRNILIQKGLIEYKAGSRNNAGTYKLIPLIGYANPYTNQDTNQHTNSDTNQVANQDANPVNIHRQDKTRINNNPPTPHTGVMDKRFEEFWSVYPKKVGKGAAKTAFMKIKPSQELTDKMVEAVRVASKSIQWQKEKGQFIPNPSTWLNQGRWEDNMEVEPPKPKEAAYPHPPKMTEEEKREAREFAKYGRQNPLLDEFERRLRCKSVERTGN